MKTVKAKCKLIREMLGTAAADPEVHEKFIASKSADKNKIKEEMAALSAAELIEKSLTVFPRDEDGDPFIYDYQVRGHIKDFLGGEVEFQDLYIKVGTKEYKFSKWTYKRLVDNFIFVTPRKIKLRLPEGKDMGLCTRPLRAETQQGPRIALATSETIPEGTEFEFEVHCRQPELFDLIPKALDYGALNGLLQWRNSGKGTFTWEERS